MSDGPEQGVKHRKLLKSEKVRQEIKLLRVKPLQVIKLSRGSEGNLHLMMRFCRRDSGGPGETRNPQTDSVMTTEESGKISHRDSVFLF